MIQSLAKCIEEHYDNRYFRCTVANKRYLLTTNHFLYCLLQVNIRIERDSLLAILFSSQFRCVAPTKTFTESTGYGCFGYTPIFWTEESRLITPAAAATLYDHYYNRPGKLILLLHLAFL